MKFATSRRLTLLASRIRSRRRGSVRFEAVNAMLLDEFLKEHRKVEELEATVVQQQKDFHTTVAHCSSPVPVAPTGVDAAESSDGSVGPPVLIGISS